MPISAAGTIPNARERRVAAADRRLAREDRRELALPRELLELGAGSVIAAKRSPLRPARSQK